MQKYELYLKQPSNFLKKQRCFLILPTFLYAVRFLNCLIPFYLYFSAHRIYASSLFSFRGCCSTKYSFTKPENLCFLVFIPLRFTNFGLRWMGAHHLGIHPFGHACAFVHSFRFYNYRNIIIWSSKNTLTFSQRIRKRFWRFAMRPLPFTPLWAKLTAASFLTVTTSGWWLMRL